MNTLRRIVRGCGYLEGYGHHPGTVPLFLFVMLGAIAGLPGQLPGLLLGGGSMLLGLGPVYLCGAHSRAKAYDRSQRKK